jgi:5-methylcytosine-specific restriction endonuclease McrA
MDKRKNKKCPSCGVMILGTSKTCSACWHKTEKSQYYKTQLANKRREGKIHKYCVDCGKEINLRATRCQCCMSKGSNNAMWQGGITPFRAKIRLLFEYRQWRSDVFTRDSFTCNHCGCIGGKLQAHHVIPLNLLLQKYEITNIEQAICCSEIWNINNGITLCVKCHNEVHKIGGHKWQTQFQLTPTV